MSPARRPKVGGISEESRNGWMGEEQRHPLHPALGGTRDRLAADSARLGLPRHRPRRVPDRRPYIDDLVDGGCGSTRMACGDPGRAPVRVPGSTPTASPPTPAGRRTDDATPGRVWRGCGHLRGWDPTEARHPPHGGIAMTAPALPRVTPRPARGNAVPRRRFAATPLRRGRTAARGAPRPRRATRASPSAPPGVRRTGRAVHPREHERARLTVLTYGGINQSSLRARQDGNTRCRPRLEPTCSTTSRQEPYSARSSAATATASPRHLRADGRPTRCDQQRPENSLTSATAASTSGSGRRSNVTDTSSITLGYTSPDGEGATPAPST